MAKFLVCVQNERALLFKYHLHIKPIWLHGIGRKHVCKARVQALFKLQLPWDFLWGLSHLPRANWVLQLNGSSMRPFSKLVLGLVQLSEGLFFGLRLYFRVLAQLLSTGSIWGEGLFILGRALWAWTLFLVNLTWGPFKEGPSTFCIYTLNNLDRAAHQKLDPVKPVRTGFSGSSVGPRRSSTPAPTWCGTKTVRPESTSGKTANLST